MRGLADCAVQLECCLVCRAIVKHFTHIPRILQYIVPPTHCQN